MSAGGGRNICLSGGNARISRLPVCILNVFSLRTHVLLSRLYGGDLQIGPIQELRTMED